MTNNELQMPKKLSELKRGMRACVVKVPEYSLLAPLGVREGKRFYVASKQPFLGPFLLNVGGRKIAISRHIAQEIEVQVC